MATDTGKAASLGSWFGATPWHTYGCAGRHLFVRGDGVRDDHRTAAFHGDSPAALKPDLQNQASAPRPRLLPWSPNVRLQ